MPVISVGQLLTAWEEGIGRSHHGRALTLARLARPKVTLDELADLPLGKRDGLLIEVRRSLFGDEVALVDNCTECRQAIETDIDLGGLSSARGGAEPGKRLPVTVDERTIEIRAATTRDLIAVAGLAGDPAEHLLRRLCGLSLTLDDRLRNAVEIAIEEVDPEADLTLAFTCPACATTWTRPFDIADILWREVHALARRQLLDVHRLAVAYGWTEAEIMALTPVRRRAYLELVAS